MTMRYSYESADARLNVLTGFAKWFTTKLSSSKPASLKVDVLPMYITATPDRHIIFSVDAAKRMETTMRNVYHAMR